MSSSQMKLRNWSVEAFYIWIDCSMDLSTGSRMWEVLCFLAASWCSMWLGHTWRGLYVQFSFFSLQITHCVKSTKTQTLSVTCTRVQWVRKVSGKCFIVRVYDPMQLSICNAPSIRSAVPQWWSHPERACFLSCGKTGTKLAPKIKSTASFFGSYCWVF